MDKFLQYLYAEATAEWQRKTSLESRVLSLVSANLTVVTLFIALTAALGLQSELLGQPASALVIWALSIVAVSVLLSVGTAMPLNYPSVSRDGLTELHAELKEGVAGDDSEASEEIAEVLIEQIAAANRSNNIKSALSLGAFGAFVIAVALIVIALLTVR